jgi:hypothetical protein
MANTRGIFTLTDNYVKVVLNEWVPLSDVWIAPSPFYTTSPNAGYFGGGYAPSVGATVEAMDKVTYSSDTTVAVPNANLSLGRHSIGATGNQTAGYFGGGYVGSLGDNTSRMDKVTYLTDVTAYTPTANLLFPRFGLAATGNSTHGYFGSGYHQGNNLTLVDKVTYSTDTTAYAPTAFLGRNMRELAATGNSTAGYFGGGWNGSNSFSSMDKVNYSTDVRVTTPTANLSLPRFGVAATGNSTNGYFGGGYNPSSNPQIQSIMDKVTYSTDTTVQVPGAGLSAPRYGIAATGNSTHGYFGGGITSGPAVATIDKLTYSTDTIIPTTSLLTPKYYVSASSPKANAIPDSAFIVPAPSSPSVRYSDGTFQSPNNGYFGGGTITYSNGYSISSVEKVNYSSDTATLSLPSSLSSPRHYLAATGNQTAGYFGGGYDGSSIFSTMNKITYSTDTRTTVPAANLTNNGYHRSATGNSTNGYFGGGYNPSITATIDKVTYSTDTTALSPTANLSSARYNLAATGNSTEGYFGGGYIVASNSITSVVDKLIYSTETRGSSPANLSPGRYGISATGNATTGYFSGGQTTTIIDKLTYSSGTVSTISMGPFESKSAASGNSTHGYFAGGYISNFPSGKVTINKISYTTDTKIQSPSLYLNAARYGLAASSARANAIPIVGPPAPTPTSPTSIGLGPTPDNGYWGGGEPAYGSAVMEKVTFPTGTTALIPGANLSAARYLLAAAGNSTNGYFGGGYTYPPSIYLSTMDKVTYSTDTTVRVLTANLTIPRRGLAATGNSTAGYFGGGNYPSVATMDKVIYSTDTTVATPTANLSGTRYDLAATGNQTAGYFGGGFTPPSTRFSRMDKLTYSSDTTVYTPTANLSIARSGCYATGNSTNGYVSSGLTPSFYSYVTVTDKITYSSDTTAAVPTANYPNFYAANGAATGNSTSGYFGGSGSNQLDIYRIDYSTDTASSFSSLNSSVGGRRGYLAAAGPRSNGLPEFGINPVPNIV